MRSKSIWQFGVCFWGLAMLFALPAWAQVFTAPKNVSRSAPTSNDSQFAVDTRGNIYVVWQEQIDLSGVLVNIFFSRSIDAGSTFSTPLILSGGTRGIVTTGSTVPQIAVDAQGNINVVWEVVMGTGIQDIFFSRSTDGGATFSAPINLSADALSSGSAQIAVDDQGKIYVVWTHARSGGFTPAARVFFTRSADGVNFSAPLPLSTGVGSSLQLAVDSQGHINVAWVEFIANTDVFFTRSTDGGVTFSPPRNLSASPGRSFSTSLAVDGSGNINLVWDESESVSTFGREVFFARSGDGGVTFSLPKNLSSNAGDSAGPNVAVDAEGNINVVWTDTTGATTEVLHSRSADGGASFSPPKSISSTLPGLSFPHPIVIDGHGHINLAWIDLTSRTYSPTDVFFSRSTNAGHSFSPPINISNTAGHSGIPKLKVDSGDDIYVLWDDQTPGRDDVFISRTIFGPVRRLIDLVVSMNLKQGIAASLDAKLKATLQTLEHANQNNNAGVVSLLQAFITEVEKQRAVHIGDADANVLIAAAEAIIAWLGGA